MTPNQITGLQAFARYMVDAALDGGDVDGGTIQEIAHQYELLTKREMKGPCREPEEGYCACAFESGFPVECYQTTDALIAKPAPAEVAQGEAVLFSQFLTAVMDAAGLVRHGRQSKELSEYLGKECIRLRLMNSLSAPPSPDAELVELLRDAADYLRGLSLPAQLVKRIDAKLASLEVKP